MADAMDVTIRLQNTRKREYLKYSFSIPYGTLIIFSWNQIEQTINPLHLSGHKSNVMEMMCPQVEELNLNLTDAID